MVLEERTGERMPLSWAMTYGNQGVALILLADRRASGHAPFARYFGARIAEARALIDRLQE